MKKIVLVAMALVLAIGVNAQTRFGVKAGGNLSNWTVKSDGEKEDGYKARFGFHLGAVMEYQFATGLSIQPELLYINNGTNVDDDSDADISFKLNQLQLPINLKYTFGTEGLKMFVMAGPYFGYALSGKLSGEEDGTTVDFDLFDDSNEYIKELDAKRFDMGIGATIGVELSNKMTVGLGYQFGMANLTGADKTTVKMGTATLSVGYFF